MVIEISIGIEMILYSTGIILEGPFSQPRVQALKYWSVMDIVRPICEIVQRGEETVGHSIRPKWDWG